MTDTISDVELLKHIVFYCSEIESALRAFDFNPEKFFDKKNQRDFDACAFYIGQIGEHANKLTNELKAKHATVPWRPIIGLRNRIFHDYFSVNKKMLFDAMKNDVPELKEQCRQFLSELEPNEGNGGDCDD